MYSKELEVAQAIAVQAGEIMRRYFYEGQQRQIKPDGTPLTIADTKINDLVIAELAEAFPTDIVIGEEASTGTYGDGRRWLCDPIDGTKAFTWGVPTAMFSLALVVDGRPVLGVCYEPMTDRQYWATAGRPAYCNGQEIAVNDEKLANGIVAVMSDASAVMKSAAIAALVEAGINTASFSGAVAKALRVAEGRFVGYIDERVNPYDMAAVDIIINQAGGRITNHQGELLDYSKDFKGAVVSNGLIHDELMALINQA